VNFVVILKIQLLRQNIVSLNLQEENKKMYKILC
jgi:hypothetical protein